MPKNNYKKIKKTCPSKLFILRILNFCDSEPNFEINEDPGGSVFKK